MERIHFCQANGFPAKTYSILFELLDEFKISSTDILASDTKPENINWYDLSEELIDSVKNLERPVIGLGHSLGAILILIAASKYPKIFKSVVLLDPPLFAPFKRFMITMLRKLNIEEFFSPAGKSKKRREYFESKKQAIEYFKSKKFFKDFDPKALLDYVNYGLIEGEKGFELKIPVEKEVAIYRNLLTEYPKSVYDVSGNVIYASKKPILWESDLNWIQKNFYKIKLNVFPGNHFFPLENPKSTAFYIKRFICN